MDKKVQRFFDAVPKDRRPAFDRLHALIVSLYPDAKVVLSYGIPTFRAKSGWVAIGYWKEGVTVYTNGPHNIAEFKAKHPRIKTGTGCINFRLTDTIPLPALKKVIKRAIEQPKEP